MMCLAIMLVKFIILDASSQCPSTMGALQEPLVCDKLPRQRSFGCRLTNGLQLAKASCELC